MSFNTPSPGQDGDGAYWSLNGDMAWVLAGGYDRDLKSGMRELHFLYHQLRPEARAYSYEVPTALFALHCELFARMRAEPSSSRYQPAITFDDGNCSDLVEAAPILRRFGLTAHFFITAGWTGRRRGFLSAEELRALHADGHHIGAHGMTHKLLTRCSEEELLTELSGAKQVLEDALGTTVRTMSLPGGRADRRVLRACRAAGFEQVFTSRPEAIDMAGEPETIGRLNLQGTTTLKWLEQVLDRHSGALQRLQKIDTAKSWAKQALGDKLYARIWALGNRHTDEESIQGEAPAL